MSLEGKVLIVTGGSRGIGRAIVLGAVDRAARVVFCSRAPGDDTRSVEQAAAALGGRDAAIAVRADVGDPADVRALFATALARHGGVDAVVNNAAVSRANLLTMTPVDEWDAVVRANLTGAFLVAREALRYFLQDRRRGHIVSVGTLSQHGAPGNASYATSKGAVTGLTRLIARQYAARGIVATSAIVGYIETQLSSELPEVAKRALIDACPQRRPGTPDEIASAVLFLASAPPQLSGQAMFTSGGLMEVPL